jgi:hypothetical protein
VENKRRGGVGKAGETDSRRFTYGIPYGKTIYGECRSVARDGNRPGCDQRAGFGIWRQESRHERARASTTCLLELNSSQKESEDASTETKEVFERYGVRRSFRRSSNTNQGVKESDIDHNGGRLLNERREGLPSWECNSIMRMCCNCSQRFSDTHQRSNTIPEFA